MLTRLQGIHLARPQLDLGCISFEKLNFDCVLIMSGGFMLFPSQNINGFRSSFPTAGSNSQAWKHSDAIYLKPGAPVVI